jgi:hypothetical protein
LEEKGKSYLDAPASRDGSGFSCGSISDAAAASSFCVGNNGKNLFGRIGISGTPKWKN